MAYLPRIGTLAFWLLAAAGVGTFGYSLMQMTEIQNQMNLTMETINQSVGKTSGLVAETSVALRPLKATTEGLQQVGQHETSTTKHLASMNNHLRQVSSAESNIIKDMDHLNDTEKTVSQQLTTMSTLNSNLLQTSQSSAAQAQSEANDVGQLNTMTATSIQELHTLNGKLSALRLVP